MKRMIKASMLSTEDQQYLVKTRNNIIQEIYDILSEYPNLSGSEVWASSDQPVFYIEVHNGDWKHEHMFLKSIMADYGFQYVSSNEEDSDNDCYTAVHSFMPPYDEYEDYIELKRSEYE